MSEKTVKMEVKDRICLLTLNQPEKLNFMSEPMAKDFKETIEKIKSDPDPRVMILTGEGRAFSAGGDLKAMEGNVGQNLGFLKKKTFYFYKSFLSIMDLEIPTIAAINGHAIGAGACLTLACDMRLAASNSKIGFTFARIGLHPGMGAEYFLTSLIGRARTFELLMTGDTISAEEAYGIGLVNHVTPPEDLMDKAMELALKIGAMPVLPIKMLKETIDAAMSSDLTAVLHKQAAYQAMCYHSDDIKEGIDSVRKKRTPHFSDEY